MPPNWVCPLKVPRAHRQRDDSVVNSAAVFMEASGPAWPAWLGIYMFLQQQALTKECHGRFTWCLFSQHLFVLFGRN